MLSPLGLWCYLTSYWQIFMCTVTWYLQTIRSLLWHQFHSVVFYTYYLAGSVYALSINCWYVNIILIIWKEKEYVFKKFDMVQSFLNKFHKDLLHIGLEQAVLAIYIILLGFEILLFPMLDEWEQAQITATNLGEVFSDGAYCSCWLQQKFSIIL